MDEIDHICVFILLVLLNLILLQIENLYHHNLKILQQN